MTRRKTRWIKQITVALGAGMIFGTLTCVRTVADTLGTGLAVGGSTGLLGPNSAPATTLGTALDLLADLIRYVPG